jgi:hypothetical protein
MKTIGKKKEFLSRMPTAQQLRERMEKIGIHEIKVSEQQKKWSLN